LSVPAALIATLACVVHPAQVEAVSWATGRKDVLALLFASACVLWHLRSERPSDRFAWLSRASFLLAALSKTTVLPLPAVLVLADVLLRRRPMREAAARQLPNFVLSAVLGVVVLVLWGRQEMIRPAAAGPLGVAARVLATLGHQLGTAAWPSTNAPMYSTAPLTLPAIFTLVACLAGPVLAYIAARLRARRALFSAGAFALLLLPVCNAVPMYFPMQDRYLSLPLLALGFGLGAGLDAFSGVGRARWPFAIGALLVLGLGLRTVQYEGMWQSEQRLWGHAVRTQPDAYYAWLKLGELRRDSGDLHGAILAYKELVRIDPQRKLGYAALLQAVALRDEKMHGFSPSHAEELAKEYYDVLEKPDELRQFASRLLHAGYLRTFELPMGRALALQPVLDRALEHAAVAYFERGMPTVGMFYVRQLEQPTGNPGLARLAASMAKRMANSPL
jgi:tetratricopeptide (TPR) repeat protein